MARVDPYSSIPLSGHWQTVAALAKRRWRPAEVPESQPWSTEVEDPILGNVRLTGRLSSPAEASRLLIAVHGLGGCAESLYLRQLVATAHAQGLAVLRLNLRGADRQGEDFYHGGLTADLVAALGSKQAQAFREVHLLGYSLGGHMVLRYLTEAVDPRVTRAAAVCPPIDLVDAQKAIDRPGAWLYRWYVLRHIKEIYREVAERREVPVPVDDAMKIQNLLEWDDRIIAGRYGFDGAHDYYRRMRVAGRLDRVRVPTLLLASHGDPMVPEVTVRPSLEPSPSEALTVRWAAGGHVAFDSKLNVSLDEIADPMTPGLEGQLLAWFQQGRFRGVE